MKKDLKTNSQIQYDTLIRYLNMFTLDKDITKMCIKQVDKLIDAVCDDLSIDEPIDYAISVFTLSEFIKNNFKISLYHSRHSIKGYEMCIEDNDKNAVYTELNEDEYILMKKVIK